MSEPSKYALRKREARRAAGIKPRGPARTREMDAARKREQRARRLSHECPPRHTSHERPQVTASHERPQVSVTAEAEEFIELVDDITGKIVRCQKFVAPPVNPGWPLLLRTQCEAKRLTRVGQSY
jgi:hypothetical protein